MSKLKSGNSDFKTTFGEKKVVSQKKMNDMDIRQMQKFFFVPKPFQGLIKEKKVKFLVFSWSLKFGRKVIIF